MPAYCPVRWLGIEISLGSAEKFEVRQRISKRLSYVACGGDARGAADPEATVKMLSIFLRLSAVLVLPACGTDGARGALAAAHRQPEPA